MGAQWDSFSLAALFPLYIPLEMQRIIYLCFIYINKKYRLCSVDSRCNCPVYLACYLHSPPIQQGAVCTTFAVTTSDNKPSKAHRREERMVKMGRKEEQQISTCKYLNQWEVYRT